MIFYTGVGMADHKKSNQAHSKQSEQNIDLAEEIIQFWFGTLKDASDLAEDKAKLWFASSKEFDKLVQDKFNKYLDLAVEGKLDYLKETPKGRLSLVILLDQFPRNIYREGPKAFAYDNKALSLALEGLERGVDKELYFIERTFFYMPFQHSEDIKIQELSLKTFDQLRKEVPSHLKETFDLQYQYALAHYDLIKEFGRFPHRNQMLNRPSTETELEFLQKNGRGY